MVSDGDAVLYQEPERKGGLGTSVSWLSVISGELGEGLGVWFVWGKSYGVAGRPCRYLDYGEEQWKGKGKVKPAAPVSNDR